MKMKKYGILCLIVALITVLAIAIPVLATSADVVYVKGGGTGNGASPETAMGELFAAIDALPESGGTVVVCGDLTISPTKTKVWTWTAKTGKVTVTGQYGSTAYNPTIKLACTTNMFLQFLYSRKYNNDTSLYNGDPNLHHFDQANSFHYHHTLFVSHPFLRY